MHTGVQAAPVSQYPKLAIKVPFTYISAVSSTAAQSTAEAGAQLDAFNTAGVLMIIINRNITAAGSFLLPVV
jgi:hypothetical protein